MLTRSTPLRRTGIARGSSRLERSAPIARTSRLPRKRATPRRSSRISSPHYLAWLRTQRCGVAVAFPDEAARCSTIVDPEHKREGVGMGQKASDLDCWACCRTHHDERHDGRGAFATMDRGDLRTFIRIQIAMYRAAYTMHLASLPRLAHDSSSIDRRPRGIDESLPASAGGHLSALELLLPQPGVLAVGSPVTLAGREGVVADLPAPGVAIVRWLDGSTTEEKT